MNKLSKIWAWLAIVSQLSCWNPQADIKNNSLQWKEKIENVQLIRSESEENASKAIYEALKKEGKRIAYILIPWSKVYKDCEGKEILLSSPKWIVIHNNAINKEESTQDFLCVEYRGHKAWIERTSLSNNEWKPLEEIEKPTTEKVIRVNKAQRKM